MRKRLIVDLTARYGLARVGNKARNEGASRIIVSEVFLTISNHTAEGKELIEALHAAEEYGVPVRYMGPLYDSQTLQRMFVERANEHIGDTDKSKVGILQPPAIVAGVGGAGTGGYGKAEAKYSSGSRGGEIDVTIEHGGLPSQGRKSWIQFK